MKHRVGISKCSCVLCACMRQAVALTHNCSVRLAGPADPHQEVRVTNPSHGKPYTLKYLGYTASSVRMHPGMEVRFKAVTNAGRFRTMWWVLDSWRLTP